jgi:hypothetical protein
MFRSRRIVVTPCAIAGLPAPAVIPRTVSAQRKFMDFIAVDFDRLNKYKAASWTPKERRLL